MEKSTSREMQVRFSKPNSSKNTITVFRVLPDNSVAVIGEIWTDPLTDEDSPTYISTNNKGEELMPPTKDFIELEEHFTSYAKVLSVQEFTQAMMAEADKIEDREATLKNIRRTVARNKVPQQIIK